MAKYLRNSVDISMINALKYSLDPTVYGFRSKTRHATDPGTNPLHSLRISLRKRKLHSDYLLASTDTFFGYTPDRILGQSPQS